MENRARWTVLWGIVCLVAAPACGDVEGQQAPKPVMVRGGGVGMGPISGVINVFVLDDDTDKPIAGAAVRVGPSAAAMPCSVVTDSTGLAIFDGKSCAGLKGPQSVTASAGAYAPATWIGVNGANLTLSLRASARSTVETATAQGTIDKWSTLPEPAMNHSTLAVILYSQTHDLGDRANEIQQGKRSVNAGILGAIDIPANVCVRNVLVDDCSWKMTTRTGRQAHYAVILDQDTKGTPNNDADDTFTVTGWAVKTGLTFNAGQTATGEALSLLADADMTTMTMAFASAPAGLDDVAALPLIELGDDGRIIIATPRLDPMTPTARVPRLTGSLSGGRYDVLGIAQDAKDKSQPATLTWLRAVNVASPVMVSRWLIPPSELAASAGTYSFAAVMGANVHGADFETMDGSRLWSVTLFDNSTSFTLPGLSPDPLPAGMVRMKVNAIEIPGVDLNNVAFDDLADKLTRLSSNELIFTR